jgi:fido (protein-threonine AMPylation protein)
VNDEGHEDEGDFAISPLFGDRQGTRNAINRRIYLVQRRNYYLAFPGVAIGHGELMSLHWAIFGEAFPDLAGIQRRSVIDIHGDRCSPPELIGEHLAQYTYWLNAELDPLEAGPPEDEGTLAAQIELAAAAHARLLEIHPFVDGNGRAARVLLNLMLRRFQLRPIEVKREDGYAIALRRAIAGAPGELRGLIERLVDEQNERLLRLHERQARRPRRFPRG